MSPALPPTTFDILYRWVERWRRELGSPKAVADLEAQLCSHLENQAFPEGRIARLAWALRVFLEQVQRGNLLLLYGPDLVRRICHALFGADFRITLLADPLPARRFLILGETGTGKEAVAQTLSATLAALEGHPERFGSLNAAGVAETLIESELFGHEAGAFTGAKARRQGLLSSLGEGGVLFLDEISESSPGLQTKLLRTVQSGEFRAVGSNDTQIQRVHVVAASNRSLRELETGTSLRLDLYHRLARPGIPLPSLRSRLGSPEQARSIFLCLINHVIKERVSSQDSLGMSDWHHAFAKRLAHKLAEGTQGYGWPGNLRECSSLIEDVLYQGLDQFEAIWQARTGGFQRGSDSRPTGQSDLTLAEALEALERHMFEAALPHAASINDVAKRLGITRQTASRRMQHFGLGLNASR